MGEKAGVMALILNRKDLQKKNEAAVTFSTIL
jgi:hypothetical protein